jgi:uncharacterized membrane protein
MSRLFYAILVGLVGAGVVHAVILLLLPNYSERDAWARLAAKADFYRFTRMSGEDAAPVIRGVDPFFDAVACRFDLSEGVVHVKAAGHVPFWSVSVYNRRGQNIYSLNDRAQTLGDLDLVLVTPAQMIELRKSVPGEFEKSVFVEADVGQGIVAVRSFVPDDTWKNTISDYLNHASCTLG